MNKLVSHFFSKAKDGGKESPVDAYFLIEMKGLFSVALLKFNKGGREAYHTHAFNVFTWFLKGDLIEQDVNGDEYVYKRSFIPKLTKKAKNHRVMANKDSWCFTIRGKWQKEWTEYNEKTNTTTVLSGGRKVVSQRGGL